MQRLLIAVSLVSALSAQGPDRLEVGGTVSPDFPVAAIEAMDMDGDGRQELLVLGIQGEVRIWQAANGELSGELQLPEPARSLISLASLPGDDKQQLVVFDPSGIHAFPYRDGAFRGPGQRLVARERFNLRVNRPRLSAIVQDVNGDGFSDLVLPGMNSCTLYLHGTTAANGEASAPGFLRAGRLSLRVTTSADTRGGALSESLSSSFTIPDLRTADVNGDGRSDLLASEGNRRLYYLQAEDGRFPEDPDVTLDLGIFRDTTPESTIEFGATIGIENASLQSRDLDGDDIPDYVIAHRRKVWVFHGDKGGPQFETPSSILKLAEDVSLLQLLYLDDNDSPDLLMFKFRVPSLGTLFKGLLFEWDVEIGAIGYANQEGKTFARKPRWRSESIVRIPSILSLIQDPEAIVERFKAVGEKFRLVVTADLNGDNKDDVLMQSEDKTSLQYWLLDTDRSGPQSGDEYLRNLLFENEDRVWDIDRILGLLQSLAEDRAAQLTLKREAAGQIELRDPDFFRLEKILAGDLDGDGREEIIAQYLSLTTAGQSEIDFLYCR
ncbi:MAG: FG-GAP repeat domain-containing protein [Planctomycetota bacterium]|jgi:hypothetical protein